MTEVGGREDRMASEAGTRTRRLMMGNEDGRGCRPGFAAEGKERGPGHQLLGSGSAAARPARQVDAWQGEQRACASSLDRVQNSADSN
ncbi:hypothetical protein L1887_59195 [Cichorium endivia]|nr:hypothetical protein L1887_59195 [Cichorium endivia]